MKIKSSAFISEKLLLKFISDVYARVHLPSTRVQYHSVTADSFVKFTALGTQERGGKERYIIRTMKK